eukprot:4348327-Pyramimonas_sp.AAC.1
MLIRSGWVPCPSDKDGGFVSVRKDELHSLLEDAVDPSKYSMTSEISMHSPGRVSRCNEIAASIAARTQDEDLER